jgi:tetratricopeptide (TPR) repeat protein/CHAT domain-containing protein
VTALGALLLVLQVASPAPAPAIAVDPAIAAVVARFYETQEKEDIEAYLALFSPSAASPQRRMQLQYVFDQGDDSFSDIVITRAQVKGDTARLRVNVRRTRTVPRPSGGSPIVITSPLSVALTLELVAGDWKLTSEGPAADHVAEVLLEASSDAGRDAVLAGESDVPGQQVLSALARVAGAAAVRQDYPRTRSVYETFVFVARRGGFKKEEGEGLQNIANALYFQRKYPEALTAYELRLALERERQDEAGMAAALAGIGTIRYSYAEYTEALARYQEALALHEKTDDVAGIAFVSLSIGNIGFLQGDFPAAIAAYRRALDLNKSMFNADGESRALEGLGRVYSAQGDYAGALGAFDTVRTDKRLTAARGRLAPVAQSIGEVHFRLGNLDAARASYEESRGHFEAVRDLPNVGRVLQGLALTELAAARFPIAEDLYKRSSGICTKADDPDCAARAVAGLAYAQSAQDRFWEAAASYRQAIDAFKTLDLREEMARSEIGLSEALAGAGDNAGAIEAAMDARREAVGIENDDVLWRALTAEARAIRRLGDRPRALGVSRAAIVTLDRMEAAALDRPAASLPPDATRAFATFAVLQAETGDVAGAFATAERLHATRLRASLATNERDIAPGMTPEDREEERRLATDVATFVARITREKGLPKPDAERLASLRQSLADASAARRAWMQRLFERLPDLAVWRGLAPATPPDLGALFRPGSLLLSFVLDDEDLLVLASGPVSPPDHEDTTTVGPAGIDAYLVPLKRRQIAELTAAMQQPAALADPSGWKKVASELIALLPQALVARLDAASHVAIVPHEVLWRVPFPALPSRDGYLADHATIVVAGSVAMLRRAADREPATAGSVLMVGAPQVEQSRIDRLKQVAPAWTLRAAEDARSELEAGTGAYSDGQNVLLGSAATERAVRDALPRAGRIHIAAPFRINAASPLFSSIVLADPAPLAEPAPTSEPASPRPSRSVSDTADDGALELREVMNVSSAARVGVLSDGAATSMRDSAPATPVLEWAWLAAGIPSLVIPRWSVPPPARDRVMTELHTRLQAGEPPAVALAAAQRLLRSTPETAAPIHWAAWMVVGAGR